MPERKITGGQKRGELPLAAEIETLKIFLIPMEAREKLASWLGVLFTYTKLSSRG